MASNIRKSLLRAGLAAAALGATAARAQTFPLSENSWNNPDFVKRFMGSYGVLTSVEPTLTTEENTLLKDVITQIQAGNTDEAIKTLTINLQPTSSAALDYTLGSLLLQQGKTEEAVAHYKDAIKKFPNFLRAYKNLGLAYLSSGQFDQALPMLQKAVELGDREGNTFGLLGYAYLNLGKYDLAAGSYGLAELTMPNNKDWAVGKASALMQSGRYSDAIPAFKSLLDKDPNRAVYYVSLANAYLSMQEPKTAALYLELLRRKGQAEADPLMLLGDIYANEDLYDLAVGAYEQAVATGKPIPAQRALRFVRALVQRGAYAQADTFMQDAEQASNVQLSDADKTSLLNLRAEVAMATKHTADAAKILEQVIQRDPLNGRALLLLGGYNYDHGDLETAQYYFQRAEKVPDVQADALVQEARLQVSQHQYAKAVKLLENAQGIDPRSNVQNYLEAVRSAAEATR